MTTMAEPHTPTSFEHPKNPTSILDAASAFPVDDEVIKTRALFEVKQPLHKLNDVLDGLHDRTKQMASLAGPVGTNPGIADLRQRLTDQDQKHKNVITEIHGILDELELLQGQYVANLKKEVEREVTERMDKLVEERVAERLKTHIPQELQDEVTRNNHESPQDQPGPHPSSQLLDTVLLVSPRNPPSAINGPSTPTLSHPPHPSALAHYTPSTSDANQLDVCSRTPVSGLAPKLTIKEVDRTEDSLQNSTPTPSTPALSSPQSLVLGQGSPGNPNRRSTSICSETEDQVEQEQDDKVEAAADKEKAEAEREAEVADEIRKLEEVALLEKWQQEEERLRKDVEAQELQRLKEEEEERRLKLKQEEERILKARQDEEALWLAQERAREEEERKEKEDREEQERISELAEETRLRLEEEAAAKAKPEAISESEPEEREKAEPEANKGNGKQDEQLEDAKTTSINSPTSDKQRPGPRDLTSTIRPASLFFASLAAARFLADITTVSYPEGYHGPHPDLNQNVKNGKFRYDREFLLQFMSFCKERPPALPPLDAIGLKAVDHTHAMSLGGSGRPSGVRQTSVGLSFSPALETPGAINFFSMGNFAMMGAGSGLDSEEGYANSSGAASVSGAPTIAPLQKRVRTKRKVNRNENFIVPGGSGGQGLGSSFYNFTNQMQNLDAAVPHQAPENLWDRNAVQVDQDSPELVELKVKGLLNELTVEKFDPISDQIIAWANMSEKETDGRTLVQVIRLVFEKATEKAAWSEMCARLCRKMMEQISTNVQDDSIRNNRGNLITGGQLFRKYLLNRCQEDFESGWVAKEATAAAAAAEELEDEAAKAKTMEGGTEKIYSDEYYAAQKIKRQRLGLIKFIGELFKLQMLTERIIHECVKKLLGNVDNPEEEEIESLCMLLATVGSMLDIQKARGHLDAYFSRLKELMKNPNVTPRMQYMLRDLLELRQRKWVARNAQQPVTFPPIIAQMKESYQRQIGMSQDGSRRSAGRGEFNNSQQVGPDGWAVAGSGSGPLRPPPKAGDLSNFGKISNPRTMTFGPSSVFPGKKGAENKREAIIRTNSSLNMFSMLGSQGPEAGDIHKVPAAAADPHPQRKRLVLQPRSVPVDVALPAAESESSHSEEEASIEMTEEAAMKKISEDLKEFFAVRNLEEAEVYFSSLPPQHHHLLIDKIVSSAVESKEDDAKLVSQFFTLAALKELCSAASFEEGLTPVAEIIDDIAIDAPKAFQLLAMMVKGASLNQERLANLASKSLYSDKLLALLEY